MEYIVEFILELVLEGSLEASKSNKIPKYIRYLLIGILFLFFAVVIGFILFTGVLALKENILAGIFLILVGMYLLIMSVIRFRKAYSLRRNQHE